ncbi:unnamed protein product [Lampetra fluviatilis]
MGHEAPSICDRRDDVCVGSARLAMSPHTCEEGSLLPFLRYASSPRVAKPAQHRQSSGGFEFDAAGRARTLPQLPIGYVGSLTAPPLGSAFTSHRRGVERVVVVVGGRGRSPIARNVARRACNPRAMFPALASVVSARRGPLTPRDKAAWSELTNTGG